MIVYFMCDSINQGHFRLVEVIWGDLRSITHISSVIDSVDTISISLWSPTLVQWHWIFSHNIFCLVIFQFLNHSIRMEKNKPIRTYVIEYGCQFQQWQLRYMRCLLHWLRRWATDYQLSWRQRPLISPCHFFIFYKVVRYKKLKDFFEIFGLFFWKIFENIFLRSEKDSLIAVMSWSVMVLATLSTVTEESWHSSGTVAYWETSPVTENLMKLGWSLV